MAGYTEKKRKTVTVKWTDEQQKVTEESEPHMRKNGQQNCKNSEDEQNQRFNLVSGVIAMHSKKAEEESKKCVDESVFLFHVARYPG